MAAMSSAIVATKESVDKRGGLVVGDSASWSSSKSFKNSRDDEDEHVGDVKVRVDNEARRRRRSQRREAKRQQEELCRKQGEEARRSVVDEVSVVEPRISLEDDTDEDDDVEARVLRERMTNIRSELERAELREVAAAAERAAATGKERFRVVLTTFGEASPRPSPRRASPVFARNSTARQRLSPPRPSSRKTPPVPPPPPPPLAHEDASWDEDAEDDDDAFFSRSPALRRPSPPPPSSAPSATSRNVGRWNSFAGDVFAAASARPPQKPRTSTPPPPRRYSKQQLQRGFRRWNSAGGDAPPTSQHRRPSSMQTPPSPAPNQLVRVSSIHKILPNMLRGRPKIGVLQLRRITEVVPPFSEVHAHLQTHLWKCGVGVEQPAHPDPTLKSPFFMDTAAAAPPAPPPPPPATDAEFLAISSSSSEDYITPTLASEIHTPRTTRQEMQGTVGLTSSPHKDLSLSSERRVVRPPRQEEEAEQVPGQTSSSEVRQLPLPSLSPVLPSPSLQTAGEAVLDRRGVDEEKKSEEKEMGSFGDDQSLSPDEDDEDFIGNYLYNTYSPKKVSAAAEIEVSTTTGGGPEGLVRKSSSYAGGGDSGGGCGANICDDAILWSACQDVNEADSDTTGFSCQSWSHAMDTALDLLPRRRTTPKSSKERNKEAASTPPTSSSTLSTLSASPLGDPTAWLQSAFFSETPSKKHLVLTDQASGDCLLKAPSLKKVRSSPLEERRTLGLSAGRYGRPRQVWSARRLEEEEDSTSLKPRKLYA